MTVAAKALVAAGHEIGQHCFSHESERVTSCDLNHLTCYPPSLF